MSDWNVKIIKEFRENDGKVGGHFANATLALLHTTGAKSGEERINPLMCIIDGDRYVVVASKGGADTHPDWYYNVLANPNVTVEYGTETFEALATPAEEPERTELYTKVEAVASAFTDYKNGTDRVIPVVILERK
ncbi:MAG: nitroreductase family deazaflavin-dependent oxidoreductase [Chloroflexi bacterium]|nr:MAG: nitroreductase family deazaflavin-dependent oxidoreductase [Chloroflexota bacterium]MBL1194378.1 nitroreductase family deazaflavin-dependent oxidoreductase [Chloroflexota bacterium]NOH11666.1 nitroreductase family deazaflavin-dependent oxidoreductase [Chloroflexota bacterium]